MSKKKIVSYNFVFDYNMFENDIRTFCEAHGLRYADLDELAGIGNGNVSNILSGVHNQKMNTWLAIANAMDIDVRTYFVLDV